PTARASAAGFRDTLAGEPVAERLRGEKDWTEIDACPLYSNGSPDAANGQIAQVLSSNPDLTALVLLHPAAQYAPDAYASALAPFLDRIKSGDLIIAAAGTMPVQMAELVDGLSSLQVGERPFQMGHDAPAVLRKIIPGEAVDEKIATGVDACTRETAETCLSE